MLSRALCPHEWRTGHNTQGSHVPIVILELLDEVEVHNAHDDLQISDSTRQNAQGLYNDGMDDESVHIYVH